MRFKWPWASEKEYGGRDKSPATEVDEMGLRLKHIMEAAERVCQGTEILKKAIEELYKINYNLVKKVRELEEHGKK